MAPLLLLWRRVLVPVAREVRDAVLVAWRVAGYVSRAVGRALKWLVTVVLVVPAAWVWRALVLPVWRPVRRAAAEARRAVRDALAAVRETVRGVRADLRTALTRGAPRPVERGGRRGEPEGRNPQ
ncbi:hypothetical protein PV342_39850 [Streptomyces sp. PA03-3a]|nr:hypothetical protein [Streptomyces sp. PA03-3a]